MEVVGVEQFGVEFHGAAKGVFGFLVPVPQRQGQAARGVHGGQVRRQLHGQAAVGFGLQPVGGRAVGVHVQKGETIGQPGVGQRVVRIQLNGARERFAGPGPAVLVQLEEVLAPAQVVLVGLDVVGGLLLDGTLFSGLEVSLKARATLSAISFWIPNTSLSSRSKLSDQMW